MFRKGANVQERRAIADEFFNLRPCCRCAVAVRIAGLARCAAQMCEYPCLGFLEALVRLVKVTTGNIERLNREVLLLKLGAGIGHPLCVGALRQKSAISRWRADCVRRGGADNSVVKPPWLPSKV